MNAGEEKQIDLIVPGFASLASTLCHGVVADSMAIVIGTAWNSDGTKALGIPVRAEWSETSRYGSSGLRSQTVWVEGTSGTGGRYTLCAVRPRTRLTVRARRGRVTSSSSELTLRESEVRRLDLTLRAP